MWECFQDKGVFYYSELSEVGTFSFQHLLLLWYFTLHIFNFWPNKADIILVIVILELHLDNVQLAQRMINEL